MSGFLLFLFVATIAVLAYSLGRSVGVQVGYLSGKAEVSNIPRGEPLDECCIEREVHMMHAAKRGDTHE